MPNPLYDALFGRHAGQATPFLILPDGSTVTHSTFLGISARFAQALTGLGLGAGDRLAVQIEKSPEALAVYAACVQSGVIFLPLNPAYTVAEVDYFVENSGARLLLCSEKSYAGLISVVQARNCQLETLNADGTGSFTDLAQGLPEKFETVARVKDDLAAFLYTSGTTGRSKGAMLTQRNLLSNAETLVDFWKFTSDDVLLHVLPIFHTHGLFVATNVALMSGGSMIFLPKFDSDEVISRLPEATAMMGVPTFYTRLLEDSRFNRDLTSHMRLFISGSAPLLAETHLRFETRTGHRILERYGMTETNMNTSNPYEGDRRAGTVGFPLPGVEARVMADGAEVTQGAIGVLEVRGPNVFQGYWQMPEKTAEELRPDGWFITGDLAQVDSDGYFSIVGRQKDLIITGGFNVYPKEIESLIDDLPNVLESAVIGVPHPDFGEAVVAVVVANSPELEPDFISAELAVQLAKFKQPKQVILVDELARNTMGKVQKKALRETYAGLFAP